MKKIRTVAVTGGAGYVGSVLVPQLLAAGYRVRVLDLYLFGEDSLAGARGNPSLEEIRGDIRDQGAVRLAVAGADAVIHLACISNDPSFELDPELGRSINHQAFEPLVRLSRDCGVSRFIYASSSSVYGVSDAVEVTEEHPLKPLTEYSRLKCMCEPILLRQQSMAFTTVVVRPATICGYSPRQRLDLTVNILTNHAVNRGVITVLGGKQMRPNLHLQDMTDLYLLLLELPAEKIAGKVYNAGYQNRTVADLAEVVRSVAAREMPEREVVKLLTKPSDDRRSYHISSRKIERELGFVPRRTIEDAVEELIAAFRAGRLPEPLTDPRYYNLKTLEQRIPFLVPALAAS